MRLINFFGEIPTKLSLSCSLYTKQLMFYYAMDWCIHVTNALPLTSLTLNYNEHLGPSKI